MFNLAIRNGIGVTVVTLVVCLLGLVSLFSVPIQMIPDMARTTLTVITDWPGASPQDIEKDILIEQEKYLRSLPDLLKMTSEATTGQAVIELEFALGTDFNEVLVRINNALSQVPSYPINVDEPRILTSAFSDNWFLFYIIEPLPGNPKQIRIENQHDLIRDYVQTAVERTPGVGEVMLLGGTERQVRVYVDPVKLAERKITMGELRSALRTRNTDVSGGDIDSGKRRYLIRTLGRYRSVSDMENTIVAMRDGAPVYLRELGYAELGMAETRSESYYEGRRNMMMYIKRQRGANIVEVAENVERTIARLSEEFLPNAGISVRFMHSDALYVQEAVKVVTQNLVLGGILALLVLYLFLRSAGSTFLGAVGIPICSIAAFLGLQLMGRTINVISLAGVAFAIGMTLDNSIVVLENIHRHRQMGKERLAAALDGVREVWTAVLASTLTTVLVFLPVVFIQQEAGQLYSDIAIAISSAIILSMLVAITLVPSASANLITLDRARPGEEAKGGGFFIDLGSRVQRGIMRSVEWLLGSPIRSLVLVVVSLAAAIAVFVWLTPKTEYLPEGEEASSFSFMFPPPGYNLETMSAIGRELNNFFVPHLKTEPEQYARGETDVPPLKWLMSVASSSSLSLIAGAKHDGHIDDLIEILGEKFSAYPGMISFSARGSIFSGNSGGTRSLDLDIYGPELAPLFDTGLRAFLRTREVLGNPQIKPSPSSLNMGQPLLEVRPDWARAAELGISAEDLGYMVWAFADGAYHDDFYLGDQKIDMFIYSTHGVVDRPQDLEQIPVYTPGGDIVPLSSLARIRSTVNTDTIRRVNGERTVTLSIVSPRDVPLETAVEIVQEEVIGALHSEGSIPPGVRMRISGASDKMTATREALADNLVLAVLLSYLLMVVIFRHWGYPLIIMLNVPLGVAGGIVGLQVMNAIPGVYQAFDMITMLGFLVLIGIVVNNPILLVEQAHANMRTGMDHIQAILESTRTRVRPILMTTFTTLFGLAPLVFFPRAGTELYRGLGIIVLFGLLFSTVFTLSFIPALLSLALGVRNRLLLRGQPPAVAEN